MSDLEDLAAAMRNLAAGTRAMAELLKEHERDLAVRAARAQAALAYVPDQGLGQQLVAAFDIARRKCADASVTLYEASAEANRYALWLTPGGGGSAAAGAAQVSADPAPKTGVPLQMLYPGEYLDPGPESVGNLVNLIQMYGRDRPEAWIKAVNPHFHTGSPAYYLNCVVCATVFADILQGVNTLPAPGLRHEAAIDPRRLWSWAGIDAPEWFPSGPGIHTETITKFAYALVAKRLSGLPPGTVAIVGADWAPPHSFGHAFNAYVGTDGALHFADAQHGLHGAWPPTYTERMKRFAAIYRVPGQPWKVMHAQDDQGAG
jgi:hypothetical protein